MFRIALRMLLHSRTQFAVTVAGLGVMFFLTSAVVGLLVGWCNTTSAVIRHAPADVWVMMKQTPVLNYGRPMSRQRLSQVRSVPGVAWAEGMIVGWAFCRTPNGRDVNVQVVGLDQSGAGGPWEMASGSVDDVHRRRSVIVDELDLETLGLAGTGDELEFASQRAAVRGVSRDVRTFTATPFVFTSLEAAREYDRRYAGGGLTYVLVRTAPGQDAADLCRRIEAEVPHVEAVTSRAFAVRTMRYWMLQTGAGITIVITAVLGLVVGGVITSQTLFAITESHRPEYAALLAVGFRRGRLVSIVALQSLVVGAAGLLLGSILFWCAMHVTAGTPIRLETNVPVFGGLLASGLASAHAASLFSIRSVLRIDPVLVFRG